MICIGCVYHNFFKAFVSEHGCKANCDYCGNENICVKDEELEQIITSIVEKKLVTTDELSSYEQCLIFEGGSDHLNVYELSDFYEAHLNSVTATFAQRFIEKLPDEKDSDGNSVLYVVNDGYLDELNDFEIQWNSFNQSIRHSKRFFNNLAHTFCDGLFDTIVCDGMLSPALIVDLPVTQPIYRARIGYSVKDIESISEDPMNQLGRVPPKLSGSQRMTPAGVSAFYGAFDRDTCISELRPIVGDGVVSAEFRANRQMKLLNLNALNHLQSDDDFFSERWRVISHAYAFFPELVFKLTRPSSRNNQHEYLATQVIFEYLHSTFDSQIDGIIYPSTQKDGASQCVVMFPDKSLANQGFVDLYQASEPFNEINHSLFYVPSSVRFHRVRSAAYDATDEGNHVALTTPDSILKKVLPSAR